MESPSTPTTRTSRRTSSSSKKRQKAATPSRDRPPKTARRTTPRSADKEGGSRLSPEKTGHSYHFGDDILPILKKFMDISGIRYAYRGEVIGSEDDVRRWMCSDGVPELGNALTNEEEEILTEWASFANVKPSDLLGDAACSEDDIIFLLGKMGLREGPDGRFRFASGRGAEFSSLTEIRDKLRTHGRAIFPRAAYVNNLDESDQVNLRLWAAGAVASSNKTIRRSGLVENSGRNAAQASEKMVDDVKYQKVVAGCSTTTGHVDLQQPIQKNDVKGDEATAISRIWGFVGRLFSRR